MTKRYKVVHYLLVAAFMLIYFKVFSTVYRISPFDVGSGIFLLFLSLVIVALSLLLSVRTVSKIAESIMVKRH
ncbi:hypothetical protein ACFQ38_09030 [Sporosarcina contaminans]|uniref:Uncharacterized protein n=1 Tax=Sporosarcina contaminans TaxID=633403 RepID=A0ABW3TWU7_9BACL